MLRFFPSRLTRRQATARRAALITDAPVELPCRARRTTARGWGEWVDGLLRLPDPGGTRADFVADDPHEVALVARQGAAPVVLEPPLEVAVRAVRYKAEAFHGPGSQIITVTSPRRTVEIALPGDLVEPAAQRLASLV